jgi:hypothetical protein
MNEIYKKQWNRQYQLKLDLGEGQGCHEAYEEYLDYYKLEDNNERWVSFCAAFTQFEGAVAMAEKARATVQ